MFSQLSYRTDMNRWRSLILTVLTLLSTVASAQESTVIATRGKRFWTGFMQNGFGAQSLKVHILSRVPPAAP